MTDDFAKDYLHGKLRSIRQALVWKLDSLSEYDVRRPLTATGLVRAVGTPVGGPDLVEAHP